MTYEAVNQEKLREIFEIVTPESWTVHANKDIQSRREVSRISGTYSVAELREITLTNNWQAFLMKKDGTTIFYRSANNLDQTEEEGSYLHVFKPKQEKSGLISIRPSNKEEHVGAYPFKLKTCFSTLAGTQ